MQLNVSSSLEGRDLALLKSVINILHSDYAGEGDCNWQYSNDDHHQIFISQDFYQNGSEYYALIKEHGKRISIGTQINPKILRRLFEQLGAGNLSTEIDKDYSAIAKDKAVLLKHVYRYMSSQVKVKMCFSTASGLQIVIDKQTNKIVSNVPLLKSLIKNELFTNEVNIGYAECAKEFGSKDLKFSGKASHFFWQMGLLQTEALLQPDFYESHVRFKQTKWPDYGCIPFENSFITMSALLWRRAESFDSLKENHNFTENELIAFLNAMSLSGACIVSTSKDNSVVPLVQKPKEPSGFLSKLKQKLFRSGA
ncbi:hypothetical protein [Marinicella rhabdoformis]|uniref:hypothetical protein n=1 Tax=Marinicella rhabdoformis TaxID=2580566 RepID=UPI0012AECF3F|nr:hypothetical protein [Marinicella rhabdoformis]